MPNFFGRALPPLINWTKFKRTAVFPRETIPYWYSMYNCESNLNDVDNDDSFQRQQWWIHNRKSKRADEEADVEGFKTVVFSVVVAIGVCNDVSTMTFLLLCWSFYLNLLFMIAHLLIISVILLLMATHENWPQWGCVRAKPGWGGTAFTGKVKKDKKWKVKIKHCQRHYEPRRWLLWPVILVW